MLFSDKLCKIPGIIAHLLPESGQAGTPEKARSAAAQLVSAIKTR
jgi:hypothetical protein